MLGRLSVLTRMAWRSMWHRPGQTAMLLVALCLATSSVAIGLNVSHAADGAIRRLTDATDGYHVYVKSFAEPGSPEERAASEALDDAISGDARVAAVGGPWPVRLGHVDVAGQPLDVRLVVRSGATSPVDQPLLTSGTWLVPGSAGVVVEDGLASSLELTADDTIVIDGAELPVLGTAMSSSTQRFPLESPGLMWISPGADDVVHARPIYSWTMIRMHDPGESIDYAGDLHEVLPESDRIGWEIHEWVERHAEEESANPTRDLGAVLLLAGSLLALLATATAAVLVSSRLATRARQVGTLKAIGATPRQTTGVVAIEALMLAATAVVTGLATGALAAPRLAETVTTLYGGPLVRPLDPMTVLLVAGVAVGLVAVGVVRPALLAARTPTTRLLHGDFRPPPRRTRAGRLLGRIRLPVHVDIAARTLARRPQRVLANLTCLGLAVALGVLGLMLRESTPAPITAPSEADPLVRAAAVALFDKMRAFVLVAATLLVALALLNTVITATYAAIDARRNNAVLAALGATPRQLLGATAVLHVVIGAVATALGLATGRLLYRSFGADLQQAAVGPQASTVVIVAGTATYVLAILGATSVVARQPLLTRIGQEHT